MCFVIIVIESLKIELIQIIDFCVKFLQNWYVNQYRGGPISILFNYHVFYELYDFSF